MIYKNVSLRDDQGREGNLEERSGGGARHINIRGRTSSVKVPVSTRYTHRAESKMTYRRRRIGLSITVNTGSVII